MNRDERMIRRISEYVFFFMIYSVIGWIYETVLETAVYRTGFSNRGVLTGPWLPVYGVGAVIFLLLWYRLIKDAPAKKKAWMIPVIFLLTALTATLVELIASYLCEWTLGSWPWQTYTRYAFDFQGRIAPNPSIRFGLGGVLFLYVIQPLLDRTAAKMNDKTAMIAAVVILTVLLSDIIVSFVI